LLTKWAVSSTLYLTEFYWLYRSFLFFILLLVSIDTYLIKLTIIDMNRRCLLK
jgi:hypothetical protein